MEQFARFYYEGGGFMHLVSLSFLAALACSVAGLRRLRRGEDRVPGTETLVLARSLRGFCFGVGVFGSLLLLSGTLHGVAAAESADGASKYLAMAMHPVLWALFLLGPLALVVAIRRHFLLLRDSSPSA